MKDLVEITEKEFDVILDIRYASKNNVCSHELYSRPFCYLHKDLIDPFKKAITHAKLLNLRFKIWDAYRPFEVQQYMYDKFPGDFVSNPKTGSVPHCRGLALDLTLIDQEGSELEMGSDFDEFSNLAHHNCNSISKTAIQNRLTLIGIMTIAGFDFYSKEWWHYQSFNPRKYPVIEASKNMVSSQVIQP